MKNIFFYQTGIGSIGIAGSDEAITNIFFTKEEVPASCEQRETRLLKEASKQLNEYMAGNRKIFDLPLAPQGTEFQKKVWQALQAIPHGEARTYKQVAEAVGNPKACRAVGLANNKNPIAIIIPCHRVIGSTGNLVGYAGGLDVKARLLRLEKVKCSQLFREVQPLLF